MPRFFLVIILFIVIVNVVKAILKWLSKTAPGGDVGQAMVDAARGRAAEEQGGEGPPVEIRRFLEEVRRRQAQAARMEAPTSRPTPQRPRSPNVEGDEQEVVRLVPEAPSGEAAPRLVSRRAASAREAAPGPRPVRRPRRARPVESPQPEAAAPKPAAQEVVRKLYKPKLGTVRKAVVWSEILGPPISRRPHRAGMLPFREPLAPLRPGKDA